MENFEQPTNAWTKRDVNNVINWQTGFVLHVSDYVILALKKYFPATPGVKR